MTLETAFAAMRLSCWGVALVLAWLVLRRLHDKLTGRALQPGEKALNAMHPGVALFCAGLLALTTLLAFTAAILNSVIVWLAPRYPESAWLSMVCLFAVLVLFVRQIAYRPRHKLQFCAVWLVLSHLAIGGQAWFRQG